MKKWFVMWGLILGLAMSAGDVCPASRAAGPDDVAEPNLDTRDTAGVIITFLTAEDRTALGYNTSMNFWYVGGEVAFRTGPLALEKLDEGERCVLAIQAVSPVTDAVPVVARVWAASEADNETFAKDNLLAELIGDIAAQPGTGNEVRVDLSDFSGQTIVLEVAYVWDQSSLVTIWTVAPETYLLYEAIPAKERYADLLAATMAEARQTMLQTWQLILRCISIPIS